MAVYHSLQVKELDLKHVLVGWEDFTVLHISQEVA